MSEHLSLVAEDDGESTPEEVESLVDAEIQELFLKGKLINVSSVVNWTRVPRLTVFRI